MLSFAIELAQAAGDVLRDGFDRPHEVRFKGAIDLVTEMDLASEAVILEGIRTRYPDHAILSEEAGAEAGASSASGAAYRWVVDPLDGTTNYAHGLPLFCVSIGLEHHGERVLGVIYAPMLGELYATERGGGATLNGRPLRVSTTERLERALLVTGFPYDVQVKATNLQHFSAFIHQAQAVRRLGSAALDLAWVAAGRFDGFWEPRLAPWDLCAGTLLVEEAGGRVSGYAGGPFSIHGKEVLATNGRLHDAMCGVLASERPDADGPERPR
ncbi:MAG: inositol monophosphatase family protein [Candidatus Sericytochromatia bacterium]|nr:inositol monophosphatase family protein [Candidatus Sericytochromatia bacterium]